MEKSVSGKTHPLRSFITGFLLSAGLSLFFHFGILITYHHFPVFLLVMTGLIVCFSLLFWMNIKYDHMLDLNEVFSKTISFHMKTGTGFARFFVRFMRPLNPYIGTLTAIMVLIMVLWGVPALIIYLVAYPAKLGTLMNISVFCLSVGVCISCLFSNKDAFPSVADKLIFIAGILCGTGALINIL